MCRHRVQVLRSNDHEQLAIWSKTNSGARERERMTDWPRPNYKRIHNVHLFNQGNRFSIHYSSNKIAVKWRFRVKIAKKSVKICDFHLKLHNDNFLNEMLFFKLELKKILKLSITYVSLEQIFGDPFGTVFVFENVILTGTTCYG